MDIKYSMRNLSKEIVRHANISSNEGWSDPDNINPDLQGFPENLKTFYNITEGLVRKWSTNEPINKGEKIYGRINILPSKYVLGDWKGVVYFDNHPGPGMEKFKIVDFFQDEVCAGYYHDEHKVDLMMIYSFEDEPESLNVNFLGYLELMFMSRGFNGWQRLVQHLGRQKHQSGHAQRFQEIYAAIIS
jgi:hypothetical protein